MILNHIARKGKLIQRIEKYDPQRYPFFFSNSTVTLQQSCYYGFPAENESCVVWYQNMSC